MNTKKKPLVVISIGLILIGLIILGCFYENNKQEGFAGPPPNVCKDGAVANKWWAKALAKDRANGKSARSMSRWYSVWKMKAGGYTIAELKAGGYTAAQMKEGGYTLTELKTCGYTLTELKAARYTAAELKAVGYTAAQLKEGGYTAGQLRAVNFTAGELQAAPVSDSSSFSSCCLRWRKLRLLWISFRNRPNLFHRFPR